MQNRRIIDKLAASIDVTIKPKIVGNSFLAICAHLRHGEWASIVPHTVFYAIGGASDLVAIDLVDPIQTQLIGLVLSDRDPPTPMAGALIESIRGADIEADLSAALKPR
jgi:DNA-binding transcriptional LysR family regulator